MTYNSMRPKTRPIAKQAAAATIAVQPCLVIIQRPAGTGTELTTSRMTEIPVTPRDMASGRSISRWDSTGSATALTSSGVPYSRP